MYITSHSIRIVLLPRYVNIYGTMAPVRKRKRRRRGGRRRKEGKKEERMREIEYSTISTAITNLN